MKFLLHITLRAMAWLRQVLSRSRTSCANVLLQGLTLITCCMNGGMCRVRTVIAQLSLCLAGLSALLSLLCLFSIIPSTSHLLHLPRMLHKREQSFTMTGQSFLCHPYLPARLSSYKILSHPPGTNRVQLSRCVRIVCLMSSGWRTGSLLGLVVFSDLCMHRPHPHLMHRTILLRHHPHLLPLCDVLPVFSLLLTSQCFTTPFLLLPILHIHHVSLPIQLR